MDVMKPELMWVDGRCYRVPFCNQSVYNRNDTRPLSYEDDTSACADAGSDHGDDYVVDVMENGKYRSVFKVSRSYYCFLIGQKGTVRRRLEEETRTQIRIPTAARGGDIVITGNDEMGVITARRRMNLIVISSRHKLPFTHFFSLRMMETGVVDQFLYFKEKVLNMCREGGIDESLFQAPEKLHLTLGMLALHEEDELNQVGELLRSFRETHIPRLLQNQPLKIRMIGISHFEEQKPDSVDVLYGKVEAVDGSDTLQRLADELVAYVADKGLMKLEPVILHVTLMNSKFRGMKRNETEEEYAERKRKRSQPFDAQDIIKKFNQFDFGVVEVKGIHLSSLAAEKAEDGYYQSVTHIDLL